MSKQRTLFECGLSSPSKRQRLEQVLHEEARDKSRRSSCFRRQPAVTASGTPDDIAMSPQQPPVQPTGIVYPATDFSGKRRSFNPSWFSSYQWLEYSIKADACYCYPCRLFGSECGISNSRPVQTFTVKGFKDWKNATVV